MNITSKIKTDMFILIVIVFISTTLLTSLIFTFLGGNILATGFIPLVVAYFVCRPLVNKANGKDLEDAFRHYNGLLRCAAIAHYIGDDENSKKALIAARLIMSKFNKDPDIEGRFQADIDLSRKAFMNEIKYYEYSPKTIHILLRESLEALKLN